MRILAHGKTDVGAVREHNEDAFHNGAERGFFIVADGMGGQLAGEIASRMAVDVVRDYLERSSQGEEGIIGGFDRQYSVAANRLASGIRLANQVIYEAGKSNPGWRSMGTTIVVALLDGSRLSVAHVGDSRCYLVRGGALTQLTDDHSLVAEQERQGLISKEEAAKSQIKNIITRALGEGPDVEVDLNDYDLIDGDRILLCSDGLSNMVTEQELLAIIDKEHDPALACDILIGLANSHGGRDNITAILAYFSAEDFMSGLRNLFRRR